MWNTILKLIGQLLIAKFLRKYMQDAEASVNSHTKSHINTVKQSMAALVESHAALFKAQFHSDMQRVVKSLLGFTFIFFALLCTGLTALMWRIAKNMPVAISIGKIMVTPKIKSR